MPGDDLPHHHHLLLGELDGGDAERDVRVCRHVGHGGLVTGVGVGPDLAPAAQGDLFELGPVARRVAAEESLAGEGVGAAGPAAATEEGWGPSRS